MADDDSAVFFDAASQHGETEAPVDIAAATAMHDPLEADVKEATLASGFDLDDAASVDEFSVGPAADDEAIRKFAFHHISNNPVREIQPKKGWKSAKVIESRSADNYQNIFQYLCQLFDFPACFDRQNRRFIKCWCLKKLSSDDLELLAQSIG